MNRVSFEMAAASVRPAMTAYRLDEDGSVEKFCRRCGDWWPATTEFFYHNAGKEPPLMSWCKSCIVDWQREHGRRGQPRAQRQVLS